MKQIEINFFNLNKWLNSENDALARQARLYVSALIFAQKAKYEDFIWLADNEQLSAQDDFVQQKIVLKTSWFLPRLAALATAETYEKLIAFFAGSPFLYELLLLLYKGIGRSGNQPVEQRLISLLNTNKCPPECCSELYELELTDTLILQKQQLCPETDYSMYIRGLDAAQTAHQDFVEYLLEKTNTGYSKELVTFLHKSIKAVPAFTETAVLLLKKALARDFAQNSQNYQWNMELGHLLPLLPAKQRAEIALSMLKHDFIFTVSTFRPNMSGGAFQRTYPDYRTMTDYLKRALEACEEQDLDLWKKVVQVVEQKKILETASAIALLGLEKLNEPQIVVSLLDWLRKLIEKGCGTSGLSDDLYQKIYQFKQALPEQKEFFNDFSLTMLRKCGLRNTYSEAKSLLICDNSQWEKSLLQSADMLNERASEIRQAGETFCKLLVKLHPDEYFDLLDYEQKCCLSAFIDDENMQQFKLQLQEEQDILTLLKKETDSVYTYLK